MTKQAFLDQFECRLVELDLPARKRRSRLAELGDHHDFLVRTALKEGLAQPEAEAQASRQLGEPVILAETAAAEIRQGSWWGRHPILGFITLPLITLFPAFLLTIALMLLMLFSRMTQQQLNGLFNSPNGFKEAKALVEMLFQVQYLVLTLTPLPFYWLARRSASGLKWATVPCLICAAQGMFFQLHITTRGPGLGYYWTPNLLGGAGPLLVAAAGYLRQWLALRKLPELPANWRNRSSALAALNQILSTPIGGQRPGASAAKESSPWLRNWLRKAVRTPTYYVVIVILLLIPLTFASMAKANKVRAKIRAEKTEARHSAWPAEREAVAEDLRARQNVRETFNETTINLQPYINADLSESTDGAKGLKENSLLELPRGNHVYAGVPFEVEGRIQLMGRGLERWKRVFPAKVKDIKVARKCGKIHLFHGENCAEDDVRNTAVARLVLHYADGSVQQIDIKSGEHLLDWWGPIYKTDVDKTRRDISSPDSELAWVGTNAWIKKRLPDYSLRLYKSTFENPQPNVELASIDYVSTMTSAGPFMLGLTVE